MDFQRQTTEERRPATAPEEEVARGTTDEAMGGEGGIEGDMKVIENPSVCRGQSWVRNLFCTRASSGADSRAVGQLIRAVPVSVLRIIKIPNLDVKYVGIGLMKCY